MKASKFKFKNNENVEYIAKLTYMANGQSGICYNPATKKPKILIDKRLQPKRELAVSIEEFCHAFFYDKLEKEVRPFSKVLAGFLYKNGWRKIKD